MSTEYILLEWHEQDDQARGAEEALAHGDAATPHLITYAHIGFSWLHSEFLKHDLGTEAAHTFANMVNERDEAGTLFPKANVTAIPKRFFRADEPYYREFTYADYERALLEAFRVNEEVIRAKIVYCEFRLTMVHQAQLLTKFVDRARRENFLSVPDTVTFAFDAPTHMPESRVFPRVD